MWHGVWIVGSEKLYVKSYVKTVGRKLCPDSTGHGTKTDFCHELSMPHYRGAVRRRTQEKRASTCMKHLAQEGRDASCDERPVEARGGRAEVGIMCTGCGYGSEASGAATHESCLSSRAVSQLANI